VFHAPPEVVFRAWTDPRQLAEWWGPKGFTNPVCEVDVRVGGAIRIHMRAPNGVVYPMTGVFKEVSEPDRLVFVSSALDEKGNSMFDVLNTILFVNQHGKTRLTLRAEVIRTTAVSAQFLGGMEAGWTSSLDRLAGLLASLVSLQDNDKDNDRNKDSGKDQNPAQETSAEGASADREIASTRLFDAPPSLVWKMWTEAEHVVEWWGPKGFSTTIQEMDVRPGGTWRLVMRGPDGRDYKNRILFREVVAPEKLVYEHSPEPGSEPVRFQTTVTFTGEGEKTRVSVRMLFPTAAQRDHVAKTYGAVEGLEQTLSRLEEKLQTMPRSAGKKLVWLVDVSLDGFMSGLQGELDWAAASMDQEMWSEVNGLLATVDATLFGRVTYQLFERYWPGVSANPASPKTELEFARWIEKTPKHVASSTLHELAWKNSFLLEGDPAAAVRVMQSQPGSNLLLFGSCHLASRLLDAGFIDEVHLRFHPVILGRGQPLFQEALRPCRWRMLSSKALQSGVIWVTYAR
jgi:uncharacterized protein YndB with AHSA1/START domain/dihydrofolate reductase